MNLTTLRCSFASFGNSANLGLYRQTSLAFGELALAVRSNARVAAHYHAVMCADRRIPVDLGVGDLVPDVQGVGLGLKPCSPSSRYKGFNLHRDLKTTGPAQGA